METGALSHIGKRRRLNEDSYFVENCGSYAYALVADGMGGHQAGDIASSMVNEIVHDYIKSHFHYGMSEEDVEVLLRRAFIEANNKVYNYACTHSKMMGLGTTATFAMLYRGKLFTAHVGDSRAYMIDESGIRRMTVDHSYVQELVARGELTPEQAEHHPKKNYITRAMGTEEYIKVDTSVDDYNGEVVLLCSDGLTNMVTEQEIRNVVLHSITLSQSAETLVQIANDNGGADNITVVEIQDRGIRA